MLCSPMAIKRFLFFILIIVVSLITVCWTVTGIAATPTTNGSFTSTGHPQIPEEYDNDTCLRRYTVDCFLGDINQLLYILEETQPLELRPGVYISAGRNGRQRPSSAATEDFPDLPRSSSSSSSWTFDNIGATPFYSNTSVISGRLIFERLKSYLRSLTLTINVANCKPAVKSKTIGNPELMNILFIASGNGSEIMESRSKKAGHFKKAALWAAATMAAIGGSALFAVTGKAAAASLAALILGLVCLMKGHGIGRGHGNGHYTSAHISAAAAARPLIDTSDGFRFESTGEAYIDAERSNYKRYKYVIDDRTDQRGQQQSTTPKNTYKYYRTENGS